MDDPQTAGSALRVVATGLAFPESPRWHDGRWWLSEKRAGRVLTLDDDGDGPTNPTTVAEIAGEPGGLGWTPDGDMLVVAMARRAVARVAADGSVSDHADLTDLTTCRCNDMVVDRNGNAYVGDFGYDLLGGADPEPGVLVLVRPDGTASIVADDLHFPNGCVISDQGRLVVAESAANRLTSYRIDDDGSLSDRRLFADLGETVPDGITIDAEGAIWLADPLDNQVVRVREGGEVVERRPTDQGAFACELGGPDGTTLLVCTFEAAESASPTPRPVGRLETTRVQVPRQ